MAIIADAVCRPRAAAAEIRQLLCLGLSLLGFRRGGLPVPARPAMGEQPVLDAAHDPAVGRQASGASEPSLFARPPQAIGIAWSDNAHLFWSSQTRQHVGKISGLDVCGGRIFACAV